MQHVDDKRFYRGADRILGGVCSGLAESLHIDPLWVRAFFVLLVFVQGVGIFIYVVLWLVMPEHADGGATRSGFEPMTADLKRISSQLQNQFGSPASRAQSTPVTPSTAASPQDPGSAPTPPSTPSGAWHQQPSLLGLILVVVGLLFLGSNIGIINWSVVWPAALITIGIVLLVRNFERRT